MLTCAPVSITMAVRTPSIRASVVMSCPWRDRANDKLVA